MSYKHLSQTERYQIYALKKLGHSISEVAHALDRHKSTISRELSRNAGKRSYRPRQADILSTERSLGSRNARVIEDKTLKEMAALNK